MIIKIDYYLKQDGMNRLMRTTVTENDLIELLERKFREGDLACPIHFNREKVEVKFVIESVTN